MKEYIEKTVNKIGKTSSGIIAVTIITSICLAVFGIIFNVLNSDIINTDIFGNDITGCIKGIIGIGLIEAFCFKYKAVA